MFFVGYLIFGSYLLDQIDGKAARKYNQCSQYGLLLDYCTDTLTTCMVYSILTRLYPSILLFATIHMMSEIFGCVLSVANTVRGSPWKGCVNFFLFKIYMDNSWIVHRLNKFKWFKGSCVDSFLKNNVGICEKTSYTFYSLFLVMLYVTYYSTSNMSMFLYYFSMPLGVFYMGCSYSILHEGLASWSEPNL